MIPKPEMSPCWSSCDVKEKKKKRIIAAILRSWLALVPTVFKPCDQKKQI